VNYKKIALVMCLASSFIIGNDNNEERIKKLEETVSSLSEDIKALEENVSHSVVEHNDKIMTCASIIKLSALSVLWFIQEKRSENSFYLFSSYIVTGALFVTLPIDYFVKNYLLKKAQVKKEGKGKNYNIEIIA
jgi:hypothetical protein